MPDHDGHIGLVAVAAAAHAGVLLLVAGLGLSTRHLAEPTRQRLLHASMNAAKPTATLEQVQFLAACALVTALEVIGGDGGP